MAELKLNLQELIDPILQTAKGEKRPINLVIPEDTWNEKTDRLVHALMNVIAHQLGVGPAGMRVGRSFYETNDALLGTPRMAVCILNGNMKTLHDDRAYQMVVSDMKTRLPSPFIIVTPMPCKELIARELFLPDFRNFFGSTLHWPAPH